MPNHRTRTIHYTPRMNQWQALEAMPLELRVRVNNGAFSWDAYSILRVFQKRAREHGVERAVASCIRWLDSADATEAAKPWRPLNGERIPSPSTFAKIASLELEDLLA